MSPKKPADDTPATTAAEPTAMAGGLISNGDHMSQVRELLFGEQLRQIEQRFAELEHSLRQQSDALRDDLQQQLQAEQGTREHEAAELERSLQQLAQDQENRISAVEDDFQAALTQARQELNHSLEQLSQRQQQDQQALAEDKVSRSQMADLLQQLAEQLRQLPGSNARGR